MFLKILKKYWFIFLLGVLTLTLFQTYILKPTEFPFPADDIAHQYLPWKSIIKNTFFNEKALPFWDIFEFSGTPLISNPLTAFFYPGNLLYLFLPLTFSFKINLIFDVFLIGIFTYYFAKLITENKTSAFFSAVIMMFSGQIIARIYAGHLSNLDVIVWLPLTFLLTEKLVRTEKYLYSILLGISMALMILAGQLEFTYFGLIAVTIYFLCRTIQEINLQHSVNETKLKKIFFNCTKYLLAIFIALCLSAVQLFPTLELNVNSVRATGVSYDFASSFSLPIPQVISFIFPHAFGSPLIDDWWGRGNFNEFTAYVGLLPLFFAFSMFFKRNKYSKIFLLIAFIAFFISLGSYGGFYYFIYKFIPGFKYFRIPATFLFVYVFSISILAGFGLNQILSGIKQKLNLKNKTFLVTIILLIIFSVIALGIYFEKNFILHFLQFSYKFHIKNYLAAYEQIFTDSIIALLQAVILFILLILFYRRKITKTIFTTLIIATTIVFLFLFDFPFVSTQRLNLEPDSTFIKSAKKYAGNGRVLDLSLKNTKILRNNYIPAVTGYNPSYLNYYRDYVWKIGKHLSLPYEPALMLLDVKKFNLLKLLNVNLIISPYKIRNPNIKFVTKINSNYFYTLDHLFSTAFVVPNATIANNNHEALSKVSSNSFDGRNTVVLEKKPSCPSKNKSKFIQINKIEKKQNSINFDVNSPTSGFLVLSEVWDSGWKANINGKTTEIYRANGTLRAICLPPGNNHIFFTYQPRFFLPGLLISIITLIICAGIIAKNLLFGGLERT